MRVRLFEDTAAHDGVDIGGAAPSELEEIRALGKDSLADLIAARRRVLLADQATLCDSLSAVWGVSDETSAERQIFSFAAAAAVSPSLRMHALLTSSTSERLSAALCALREQERRLAALLALRSVPRRE
mmetsp:Transcript_4148/g.9018  ORF Transcript_4148/g.9018 Transcript_4148/m.9018 type:complete len:129 (-) Transcript_4148:199-585(-)